MKRLWIAVAILVTLFSATLANSHFLSAFTLELSTLLTQAEALAEAGDWGAADRLTQIAMDDWHARDKYLYTVLRHSDTDAVHIAFREVMEFIRCEEGGEYSAANARLITQVELIAEMERFSLENLL